MEGIDSEWSDNSDDGVKSGSATGKNIKTHPNTPCVIMHSNMVTIHTLFNTVTNHTLIHSY